MELITLENQSMADLTIAFNEGFSDYAIPINATEEYLTNRWTGSRVDLAMSGGVMVFGKLVSIVIISIDEKDGRLTAYNAGTCTHPMYRRMGMVRQLFDFLLPKWRAKGVKVVELEVLQGNDAAIGAYRKIGFEVVRNLNCYELNLATLRTIANIEIQTVDEIDMLSNMSDWKMNPSWDYTNAFYQKRKKGLHSKIAILEGQRAGELIYSDTNNRLFYLFVYPDFRRKGIAQTLLASLKEEIDTIKIINIDSKSDGLISFVQNMGGQTLINQHEMRMDLR